MKHIDVKFQWVREKVSDGTVTVEFISTTDNIADITTKTLRGSLLCAHREAMGLLPVVACQD
jgi:hypothetical protein